jgi:ribulose-bisphosphate carboxylase large chain
LDRREHPYIGRKAIQSSSRSESILEELNYQRDNRETHVEVDYYIELDHTGQPFDALKKAAKMILEHGTVKSWQSEGDSRLSKPAGFDKYMAWATDIKLLEHDETRAFESGIISIAYPLTFFDKASGYAFPMTQLLMTIASEPATAFSFYRGAKIIDVRLPETLYSRLPGVRWTHSRVREYLRIGPEDPIIGTIVKPKTGLTPGLFSRAVVEAALAGARFTKADENMHLTLQQVPEFVSRTVEDLREAGFDLGHGEPQGTRFIFAPHITAEPSEIVEYAKAAVSAGANALMFSPYYGGGFQKLAEIVQLFDVPVYAHTAGMNVFTGARNWGFDSSVMYQFAARFGAAFMQLTAINGYLRPDDIEKSFILKKLRQQGLEGDNGMTLVIAGGISPKNIGENIQALGFHGRMFLAGTSVYSHPDGSASGVRAIMQAYQAYREQGITTQDELRIYARKLGVEGIPLAHALV